MTHTNKDEAIEATPVIFDLGIEELESRDVSAIGGADTTTAGGTATLVALATIYCLF